MGSETMSCNIGVFWFVCFGFRWGCVFCLVSWWGWGRACFVCFFGYFCLFLWEGGGLFIVCLFVFFWGERLSCFVFDPETECVCL